MGISIEYLESQMSATQASTAGRWGDRSAGRWFYAGMAAACILFAIDILCAAVIGPSAAWHRFATWLIS